MFPKTYPAVVLAFINMIVDMRILELRSMVCNYTSSFQLPARSSPHRNLIRQTRLISPERLRPQLITNTIPYLTDLASL